MRKWTRWQDWVAVAAGLYAALATMWTAQTAISTPVMIVLGVLLIVAGLWNLSTPKMPAIEWAQIILAALLFISPWVVGYTGLMSTAWTCWIAGGIAVIVTATAIEPSVMAHRHRGGALPSH